MKKIIALNILITLLGGPYVIQRWLSMPYCEGIWNVESCLFFGTLGIGGALAMVNMLLLFTFKWIKGKQQLLSITMLFLAALFIFPIYAGLLLGAQGQAVWMDILALALLYINLDWSNKAYQNMISSPQNN